MAKTNEKAMAAEKIEKYLDRYEFYAAIEEISDFADKFDYTDCDDCEDKVNSRKTSYPKCYCWDDVDEHLCPFEANEHFALKAKRAKRRKHKYVPHKNVHNREQRLVDSGITTYGDTHRATSKKRRHNNKAAIAREPYSFDFNPVYRKHKFSTFDEILRAAIREDVIPYCTLDWLECQTLPKSYKIEDVAKAINTESYLMDSMFGDIEFWDNFSCDFHYGNQAYMMYKFGIISKEEMEDLMF